MKKLIFVSCLLLVVSLFIGCAEKVEQHQVGDYMLALSVKPNPPKAGDNALKINLMDGQQKPIKNAEIKVTYSMPAMGNMSAVRSETQAKLKGGAFESRLSLSMLGTWTLNLDISLPGKPPVAAEFKVTTGQKGLTFVSGSSGDHGMLKIKQPRGPVVKLTKKQIDLAGVKTELVEIWPLSKEIRTVGTVAYDPKLVVAQEEFMAALEAADRISSSDIIEIKASAEQLVESVKRKLRLLGLSETQIEGLAASRKAETNLLLPEKTMWIYADIYEYELDWVKVGQRVQIKSISYPEVFFQGKVKSIEPILNARTRSNRLRILVDNPDLKLKPQMYVDVYLRSNVKHKLAVPKQAVLATGTRNLVYVDYGGGRYEARPVVTGAEGYVMEGSRKRLFVPIIKGLKKNEKIVTVANYLIDSQSQLTGGSSALYGGAKEMKHD